MPRRILAVITLAACSLSLAAGASARADGGTISSGLKADVVALSLEPDLTSLVTRASSRGTGRTTSDAASSRARSSSSPCGKVTRDEAERLGLAEGSRVRVGLREPKVFEVVQESAL